MGKSLGGLNAKAKQLHVNAERTKLRRNVDHTLKESVRAALNEEPETTSIIEVNPLSRDEREPGFSRLPKPATFTETPSVSLQRKNPLGSQKREQTDSRGNRSRRFDIYLAGNDLHDFELVEQRLGEILSDRGAVKKNDVIRAILPIYKKLLYAIDIEAIPKRGKTGTKEHKAFLASLGEAVEDAALQMIAERLSEDGVFVPSKKAV